jgi:small GTP-binding protein
MERINIPSIFSALLSFFSVSPSRSERHVDTDSSASAPGQARHKIVVMGAAKVGKSSLISQFLYGTFSPKYKRTIEEMHHGDFSVAGVSLTLDILDTSGAYEFPAMRALSISSADAFILVYDVNDASTFEEVRALRDQIHETKGRTAIPIVVVGNKVDLADEHREVRPCTSILHSKGTYGVTAKVISNFKSNLIIRPRWLIEVDFLPHNLYNSSNNSRDRITFITTAILFTPAYIMTPQIGVALYVHLTAKFNLMYSPKRRILCVILVCLNVSIFRTTWPPNGCQLLHLMTNRRNRDLF